MFYINILKKFAEVHSKAPPKHRGRIIESYLEDLGATAFLCDFVVQSIPKISTNPY